MDRAIKGRPLLQSTTFSDNARLYGRAPLSSSETLDQNASPRRPIQARLPDGQVLGRVLVMFPIPIVFRPFGVDIFCLGKKFLVYNMVSRNLKIKYRRSILGVVWTLLSPMAMTFVYYFV